MAQQKIRIRLKGYDHQQVDRSASQIVETAQRTGATITGPVPLPTEKNVYCVIRGPVQGQGLARALRGAHAQAPDRHPQPHAEDGRLADAARPSRRRRHRDQAVMKGILGRKLGMTQVFDEETGNVDAGHRDRGRAMPGRDGAHAGGRRLRRGPARLRAGRRPQALEGRARPPAQGGCRRASPPRRVPRRERAPGRRERHRRGVRAGRPDQGVRQVDRQGLPGHDQAPQLQPRPDEPRLAQRPQARLGRRLGHAVARVQGQEDGRPHGRAARHPARPRRPRGGRRAEPAARPRRRPRPEERARRDPGGTSADGRQGSSARRQGGGRRARRDGVRGRGQAASRPRDGARRAERRAARDARREEPRARRRAAARSRGARRARDAPARARSARRSSRAAASRSRPGCGASTSR